MTQVGYVRTSVGGPALEEQTAKLRQAGAETIVVDQNTNIRVAQQELHSILERMTAGDVLMVWRLDQLGRSVQDVIYIVEQLSQKCIGLHSLQDNINTNAPQGKSQLQVFVALAQCSRNLSRKNTQSGIRAARARGKVVGRPRAISPELVKKAADMMRTRDEYTTVDDIADELGVSVATLYRYVGPDGEIRVS